MKWVFYWKKHQRECLTTLQTLPSVHAAQIGECEVQVLTAYKNHIACPFGGSVKILTDNGTEFKNKLFKEVVAKLGMEMSIHSPPYRPQSNGKIERFHRFLKACIAKHINHRLEWDELTPMATACYNYFPNCSAQESAFFLFGRDPISTCRGNIKGSSHLPLHIPDE